MDPFANLIISLQTCNMETFKLFIFLKSWTELEQKKKKKITIFIYSGISNVLHVSVLVIPLLWNVLGCFFNVWLSTFVEGIIQDWNLIYGRLLRRELWGLHAAAWRLTWEHDSPGLISAAVHHQRLHVLSVIASPVLNSVSLHSP